MALEHAPKKKVLTEDRPSSWPNQSRKPPWKRTPSPDSRSRLNSGSLQSGAVAFHKTWFAVTKGPRYKKRVRFTPRLLSLLPPTTSSIQNRSNNQTHSRKGKKKRRDEKKKRKRLTYHYLQGVRAREKK